MASIRELKKDINYLIDEVIGNYFLHYYFEKEEKRSEIEGRIEEIINFRNDLIEKVNKPSENFDNKTKNTYFRDIRKELIDKVDAAFKDLDEKE